MEERSVVRHRVQPGDYGGVRHLLLHQQRVNTETPPSTGTRRGLRGGRDVEILVWVRLEGLREGVNPALQPALEGLLQQYLPAIVQVHQELRVHDLNVVDLLEGEEAVWHTALKR